MEWCNNSAIPEKCSLQSAKALCLKSHRKRSSERKLALWWGRMPPDAAAIFLRCAREPDGIRNWWSFQDNRVSHPLVVGSSVVVLSFCLYLLRSAPHRPLARYHRVNHPRPAACHLTPGENSKTSRSPPRSQSKLARILSQR